ncbi:hypothetical protein B0H10DRAFT_805716 [Mycena sp. CBHHK59/15]|nr:hypothetical protein B0H10DRAFT_805716 [Mycena sp. CBHHK59/15]
MAAHPRYAEISEALEEGVKSFRKWFHRTDTTSNAYFICLVLDPNVKDRYFRARWDDAAYRKGMKALENVFDEYHGRLASSIPQVETTPAPSEPNSIRHYGSSNLIDAINSIQQGESATADPRKELKNYLAAP